MTTYIALLRGINVGGKNIIKMAELKKVFEKIGLCNVKTYIQSGNGFFKVGMALSFAKAHEQATVTYLSALVEQNWMMIRQISELNTKLDKIIDNKK